MGVGLTIYVEQSDGDRWAPVLADGKPARFSPAGARGAYGLLIGGWQAADDSLCDPATGKRGLPDDLSAKLKKQLRYDLGGPSEVEATTFTWFTLAELESYAESVDPHGDFLWFYEIVRAVSQVLGEPEKLRFLAAFS